MKRRWIGGGVITCIALGICAFGAAPAQEQGGKTRLARESRPSDTTRARTNNPRAQSTAPDSAAGRAFDGKLVALTLHGATQPKLLDHTRFEEIHGRAFLVGKEAKATFSFPLGDEAHVAWDAVEAFYLFDDVEQYESAVRNALESVQGTVNGVIGEFFPGAKVSGVNIGPTEGYPSGNFPLPRLEPCAQPDYGPPDYNAPSEPQFDPGDPTDSRPTNPRPVPDDQDSSAMPEIVPGEDTFVDDQVIERGETRLMRLERVRRRVTDEDGHERVVIEERLVPVAGDEAMENARTRAPTKRSTRWTSPSASPR
ncbi:MAG TPA: hypothetical protein VND64_01090 [Pirellulales bacterium]|nr:hypothetical protein [Pirellulales bacterium]